MKPTIPLCGACRKLVMAQEDKVLLLKDLCARLPYSIKASYYGAEEERETWDEIECVTLDGYVDIGQYSLSIERIKPYLFPLLSITEEQKIFLRQQKWCIAVSTSGTIETTIEGIDWLNKNHFDYRGLIEKGLAIDATGLNIY